MTSLLPLGLYDEQGEIIENPGVCAVTGQPITPGDVTVRVPGTRYFLQLKAAEKRRMKPDERQALIDKAIAQVAPPSRKRDRVVEAEAPKAGE